MNDTRISAPPRLSQVEFVALIGMLFATIAFSIDAMLPALPDIAAELTPTQPTYAQLVLTSFILGMGLGTLVTGPLSDAFGRKPVILVFAGLYMVGAVLAWLAPTMELMVAARILQGFGAAGPRVVSLALVRDLYSGRDMAKIVSFAMLVFTLFPTIAPLIGAGIIAAFDWRTIFLTFVLFITLSVGWLTLRQSETLPPRARKPLNARQLWASTKEALANRQMQFSIGVQTLIFGFLFGTISSIQQIFDLTYGMEAAFPWLFGAIAILSAPAAPLNGRLVVRLGMRPLVRRALVVQTAIAATVIGLLLIGLPLGAEVWVYFLWCVTVFATLGFTIGNLNALALEPLGHIAGLAASLMGSFATIGGAVLGALIGQLYDGSAVPLAVATAILCGIGAFAMRYMPREKL
ncbi:multidrug effflux MFS transporter [Hasllibacter sp. MH4015]|uniref:multidrug effflux MFS transporter n=1 Tax=Hasllibacter sp. MH4015 TaxID=2854029 RepID=UPI001CD2A712|nr:multidrug effflux MFS transporter [Hasllibacter sp. MH4015]